MNGRRRLSLGGLDSSTTTRPPGRVTRHCSRNAPATSMTLRIRKPEATASKVASGKAQRIVSRPGRCWPARIISMVKSPPTACRSGTCRAPSSAMSPVPVAMSSRRPPVLAEGHQPVHRVVAAGDAGEHVLHVLGAFLSLKVSHSDCPLGRRTSGGLQPILGQSRPQG